MPDNAHHARRVKHRRPHIRLQFVPWAICLPDREGPIMRTMPGE